PWSCSGASLRLTPRSGGGATLEVTEPQGRSAERFVPSPDDLVPIGQAVLSQTLPPKPAPAADDGAANRGLALPPPPAHPPHPPSPPPLPVEALLSGRYAAPTPALWSGAMLRVGVPFGPWSAGVWARFEVPTITLTALPADFSMTEGCVGLSADRLLFEHPF